MILLIGRDVSVYSTALTQSQKDEKKNNDVVSMKFIIYII
jgi:hypothetical protein